MLTRHKRHHVIRQLQDLFLIRIESKSVRTRLLWKQEAKTATRPRTAACFTSQDTRGTSLLRMTDAWSSCRLLPERIAELRGDVLFIFIRTGERHEQGALVSTGGGEGEDGEELQKKKKRKKKTNTKMRSDLDTEVRWTSGQFRKRKRKQPRRAKKPRRVQHLLV